MKHIWDVEELAKQWSLTFEETQLLNTKPFKSRLGFIAQLKFYQNTGRFPRALNDLPNAPLNYLADQLEIKLDQSLYDYQWLGRTGTRHRQEIFEFLGITRISLADKTLFSEWLNRDLFPQGAEIEDAINEAYEWFKRGQVQCPTNKELKRLVRSAYQKFEQRLYGRITNDLSFKSKLLLQQSLNADEGVISFSEIKADPGRVGLDSVLKEVNKIFFIRSLQLKVESFCSCNHKVLLRYRQRINSESAWQVRQHPETIRYALYAILLYCRQREIIDSLIELLIQIVHRLTVRAERKLVKALLNDFQRVHGKTTLLFQIAEAALKNPDGLVKEVVYPVVGENTLRSLLKEYKSSLLSR